MPEYTIADLFAELGKRFTGIREKLTNEREALQILAKELGLELRFCRLEWCGKAFVPKRKDHRFCGREHKEVFANNFKDSGRSS